MSEKRRAFQHGLIVTASAGSALLVVLYTHPLATSDMRARVPFLLNGADISLIAAALGTFAVAGLLALAVAGGWSGAALRGGSVAVVLLLLLFGSGLVPAFVPVAPYDAPATWRPLGWLAVSLSLVVLILRRRARARHREGAA